MSDDSDILRLEGKLAIARVAELEARFRDRFASGSPPATVSLAEVDNGDSSALALLLEWQAMAHSAGRRIRFEQPPESLRVIARLTGVAALLGWNDNDSDATPTEEIP